MNNFTSQLGPMTAAHPPSLPALQNYEVNRDGQNEVIWQPTYHYQAYPAAGAANITFFQVTVGAAANGIADTNMRANGQFPSPQRFLITGIQLFFAPPAAVSRGAEDEANTATNWNDVQAVMEGIASLQLFIGSKPYLNDAPLSKFTQQFKLGGEGAVAGALTASNVSYIDYAVHCGKYYSITPIIIPTNQNFDVQLTFPALIPLTGDVDGRIGCILDGFLYRLSQ